MYKIGTSDDKTRMEHSKTREREICKHRIKFQHISKLMMLNWYNSLMLG